MSELVVTHRGVVYPWQCDQNGHMNVMFYVGKLDESTWTLIGDAGMTPDVMRAGKPSLFAEKARSMVVPYDLDAR